ncbi:MAG: DUF4381 domain-containing protein [Pseudomonadota bacterium]
MTEDLSTLNLVQLFELLEPVAEPPPVSLWPQTQAWIWLGMFIGIGLAWLLHRTRSRRRANAYRREALAELDAALDDPILIAGVIRRSALSAFPRRQIASLYGEDWLRFLDESYGGTDFRQGPGRVLALAPYAPVPPSPEVTRIAREWVLRHHRSGGGAA